MTTSDGAAPAGPPFGSSMGPASAGALPAAPEPLPGLPDASVMARWANEFFAAAPGGAPVAPPGPPVGVDATSLSSAPAVPYAASAGTGNLPSLPYVGNSASALPQLSEKDFRAAPQQILGGAEKGSQVAGQRPGYGTSPVSVPGAALYFIEGASGARALSHINQIAMEQAKNRPQG